MTVDSKGSTIPDKQSIDWSVWKQGAQSDPVITNGDVEIAFTEFGDIAGIGSGELQISQYRPGRHDAGIAGLWLRRHDGSGIASTPLIGVHSNSSWGLEGTTAVWKGSGLGASWTVTLAIDPESATWAWHVSVDAPAASQPTQWDIVTDQDLALAPRAQALTSEPYISQYIAYRTADLPGTGRVVAARQTMSGAPKMPLLVTAIKDGAQAHLTDGFDFYGKQARLGTQPRMLDDVTWDGGRTNQYEFGMIALLSKPKSAAGQEQTSLEWTEVLTFDPDFRGELPDACNDYSKKALERTEVFLPQAIEQAASLQLSEAGSSKSSDAHAPSLLAVAPVINGDDLDDDELLGLASGQARDLERDDEGHVLSYFADRAAHVVARSKELLVSRSHGQVLLAGSVNTSEHPVFATTTYAPGVFASHIVLGNTNMNRLVSVQRTSLNLLRSEGVRILLRKDGQWAVLGVPSAYVMELGASRWVYRFGGQTVTVTTTAYADRDGMSIELEASEALDVLMTADVEFPENWKARYTGIPAHDQAVVLTPEVDTSVAAHCPGLSYVFAADDAAISDDAPLFDPQDGAQSEGTALLSFSKQQTTSLKVVVTASMDSDEKAVESAAQALDDPKPVEEQLDAQYAYISAFMDDFSISSKGRLKEWNEGAPWFVQNALVHFLSPHGLEQYSGAAWGTRDVCQGPFEMALAFGHFDIAKDIILKVFGHQNPDGSLPQWFMFDEYAEMFQHDSHGDIPVWPLMAVYQYLEVGGDRSLLDEQVGFWDDAGRVGDVPTVADHLEQTLEYIRTHRVPGTELFCYGEGDWDDTLQPAQQSMKKEMASTWTIALLFQATTALHRLLDEAGCKDLAAQFGAEADGIKRQFAKNFIYDDVLAGYVVFTEDGPVPVIHPEDTRTGLHYRLIPMTRSIISGLLPPEGARSHEQLIEENLHYPDGVRLMNHPANYHDGVTTYFKRGEQAANIGREIGLMYTHAHIRYTEALAQLGRDSVADELLRISPVDQFQRLATSEIRQRNCYFASSDADFPDRYTAAEQWDRLRADAKDPVGVRGGWRVYSSGPGIYLRQVIQHVFGLQIHTDSVAIDPILQMQDDGTSVELGLFGIKRTLCYHLSDDDAPVVASVDGKELDGNRYDLPYRPGGLVLSAEALADAEVIDISVGVHRAKI